MQKLRKALMIGSAVSFLSILLAGASLAGTKSLVRITIRSPEEYRRLPRTLDVAGKRYGEWIDVVASPEKLMEIQSSGLPVEIVLQDVEAYLRSVKGSYRTFANLVSDLQGLAASYPSITRLDTVGTTYEGRPLLVLKISDNVHTDEDEPELLFMGLHHAREWPSLEIAYFIADTLTAGYGVDSHITDVVNSREIWVIPCVNPDGYFYCHDLGNDWRKNRRPILGEVGIDLNRNYNGSCNGDPQGAWGTTGFGGGTSHGPETEVYCGPYPFSELETQAVRDLFLAHDFVIDVSYHTYAEMVIYSWGYSGSVQTPDHDLLSDVAAEMASRITQQDGTGTYQAAQSPDLGYTASGDTDDWAYGYHHYVRGTNCIGYTVEACNSFHPNESALDQVVRENFDGAIYLCDIADSVAALMTPRVIPPIFDPMDTLSSGNYTVSWSPQNPAAGADLYQLDELTGLSVVADDAESGSGLWDLAGFSLSTARSHSATHGFRSSYGVDEAYDAMTSVQPYLVSSGDSLTFWCWYDIEENWDMAYAEVSIDGRCFHLMDTTATFTGSSGGWLRKAYSLENYVGKSVYFRFRHTTDSYVLEEGIYVDDIHPVASYSTTTTLSSSIADTSFAFVGHSPGTYTYRVKGHNTDRGWGDWSCYEDVTVISSPIPPERVVDLTAQLTGSIHLSWSPVAFDTAGSPVIIDHYLIHRDTTFDFATSTANSLAVTADTFYLDATAGDGNPSVNHFYLVRAVDGAGNKSEDSNMVGEFDASLMSNP
jgi:carboxypeptidase T